MGISPLSINSPQKDLVVNLPFFVEIGRALKGNVIFQALIFRGQLLVSGELVF